MANQKTWQRGWHVQDNTDEVHGQLRVDGDEGCVCILGTREKDFTPDAERHDMAALISAAPEMLATLRDLSREIRAGTIDAGNIENWVKYIDEVLAKAEPPRKVKRRMLVTVEVEVEAPADTHLDAIRCHAFDSVYHTGGSVRGDSTVRFVSKTVTTIGELYEE
jgi:hypothetical protein